MISPLETNTARRKQRLANWRDRQRGYRINYKAIGLAYFVELGIIGSGAFAAYQFANKYAADTTAPATQVAANGPWTQWLPAGADQTWWMMVIGFGAILLAEITRIPMVQGICASRSWGKRLLLLIGVLALCGITVKTMSQVMEQTYHPRLRFVEQAMLDMEKAEGNLKMVKAVETSAQSQSDPLNDEVARIDEQLLSKEKTLQGLGPQPKQPPCYTVTKGKGKKARKSTVCPPRPAWAGNKVLDEMDQLQQQRELAMGKRDVAVQNTADKAVAIADAETVVTAAKAKHQEAVSNSQLHSFTAMIYGTDPTKVTIGQVYFFMRLFIFLPAIAMAIVSSLLVASAYSPVRLPRKPLHLTIHRPKIAPEVKGA